MGCFPGWVEHALDALGRIGAVIAKLEIPVDALGQWSSGMRQARGRS